VHGTMIFDISVLSARRYSINAGRNA